MTDVGVGCAAAGSGGLGMRDGGVGSSGVAGVMVADGCGAMTFSDVGV